MDLLKELLSELEIFGVKSDLLQPGLSEIGSDLAMPCFSLTQDTQSNPQVIATKIALKIKHPAIVKAQALKGYLNLWLETTYLVKILLDLQKKGRTVGKKESHQKRVIVEYFSPNLAKPLSVGHLRNLFQGRALKNLYESQGYQVITDNHIGDWGTIFGIWVVGYLKFGDQDRLKKDGIYELGRLYVAMQKQLADEKKTNQTDLQDQVQAWLLKLENDDDEAWRYHRWFSRLSYQAMTEVLADLEISFDANLAESFYHQNHKSLKLLNRLQENKIVQKQADNSKIVDLRKYGIKVPFLVQKSNGARLYATSDIAALEYRQKRWNPQSIIYVVGFEQKFYFKQLFTFNQKAKLTSAKLIHYAYGLVEEIVAGKRQKMSSRKKAIYLKDVLEMAYQKAANLNKKTLDQADIKIIAQAALIFKEFSQNKKHNILFDWHKIFSLSDMSGPYVQYAAVRLQSILEKTKLEDFTPDLDYDWRLEHTLIVHLLNFEDVIRESLEQLDLSKIAFHLFKFAKLLNRYYEQVIIIDEDLNLQSSRLWLMNLIYEQFNFALSILGIKIPKKM